MRSRSRSSLVLTSPTDGGSSSFGRSDHHSDAYRDDRSAAGDPAEPMWRAYRSSCPGQPPVMWKGAAVPQDGYEASALQGLSLWPKSGVTLPSAKEWHDAVERGRGIGWIRLRGSTTSALAALNSLAVPQVSLENLRETLAICAEE